MSTLDTRIKHKRDTASNWTTKNPVLLNGEIILVDTNAGDVRVKIGDGTSTYTQLPFADEAIYTRINEKLPLSGGAMTGTIDFSSVRNPIDFGSIGWIRGKTTSGGQFDIFGYSTPTTLQVGGTYPALALKGKDTRPTYNNSEVALYSDIPTDYAKTSHSHNDIYYTKTEIDESLSNKSQVQIITWEVGD